MFKFSSKRIPALLAAALLFSSTTTICHAGVNVDVNLGIPVVAPPPPPAVYAPAPEFVLPPAPPQFVFAPELGYYVAVGTPYDIAYIGNAYFVFRNGFWYRTAYYGGPLIRTEGRFLPPLLVRHNIMDFRRYRDVEYRRYNHDRAHYGGKLFRPEARRAVRPEGRRDARPEGRKEEHPENRRDVRPEGRGEERREGR